MAAPSLSARGAMTSSNFSLLPRARRARGGGGAQLVSEGGHDFVELFLAAQGAAAGDDDLGGREFGAVALADFAAHEAALACVGDGGCRLDGCAAAGGCCRVEAGGAHGDDLGGITALHGGDGVACVDGALEGVGADHLGDVADLGHVELGGDARGDVLAAGGGGEQDVAVVARDGQDLRGEVFCQAVLEAGTVGMDDLGDACDLGGGSGCGACAFTGYQHMHVAAAGGCCGDGVEGGALDGGVVVFSNDEYGHSDHLRFVLEFFDQGGHVGHLHACAALGRFADLEGLEARGHVHAQVFGLEGVKLLLLGLHDVGQGDVARLVQAQVGGDDGGQGDGEGFEAAVHFAGDGGLAVGHFHLAGEGGLGQIGQGGEHLADLVVVAVDGLFAQEDEAGLFLVHQGLEQFGDGQGLQFGVGFDEDAAVGTNGHGGAQGFLALGVAAGDGDDFGDGALFFQAHGFFDGDFVEGVHAHLHVGDVHARAVALDAHFDVLIDYPLDWDENFHGRASFRDSGRQGHGLAFTRGTLRAGGDHHRRLAFDDDSVLDAANGGQHGPQR